ncbi:MAG: (d)CMP kinase [Candidatus Omnitrophica bacterium]|nr:(d)CMP kinase [Candidatus Omnitrophota bacterium]
MIIAIDGPAGSGKTTVAKLLADKLKISYLDTGATYRSLTLKALELGANLSDEDALEALIDDLDLKMHDRFVYLDGNDVSAAIRDPRIDKNISVVVSFAKVRSKMVQLQRRLSFDGDFVVEGRDITTVVFPNAKFKFYLDADFELRIERRYKELKAKGINVPLDEVGEDLKKRDHADMNRAVGPLKLSEDAICIDTTDLSIDEVIEKLAGYVNNG